MPSRSLAAALLATGCAASRAPAGAVADVASLAAALPAPSPGDHVTTSGGAVQRLFFATTGDTRPGFCNLAYPAAQIRGIAESMHAARVQFAVDLGDHEWVCNHDLASARGQMKQYRDAVAAFDGPWFYTMGNHECGMGGEANCAGREDDPTYRAYLETVAAVSPLPYYSFDVQTAHGLARFVVVADNAWDAAQSAWLEKTLAAADAGAAYTFIARHHPVSGHLTGNAEIVSAIRRHKYSLILTAHLHWYAHDWNDGFGGRSVVVGLGGANTGNVGFGAVAQGEDGALTFVRYDGFGNPAGDAWTVPPRS